MEYKMNSDRKKNPTMYKVDFYTLNELVNNRPTHVYFITRFNTLAQAKITSIKTWKRRPNDIDVNLKYGLYEYFTAEYRDGKPTREQLVKIIYE